MPFSSFNAKASEENKLMKLSGMLMKSMIKDGAMKCSNCTMPLTVEEIEQGKCSKCEAEI